MASRLLVPIGDGTTKVPVEGDGQEKVKLVMGAGYRFTSRGDLRKFLCGMLILPQEVQQIIDSMKQRGGAKLSPAPKNPTGAQRAWV